MSNKSSLFFWGRGQPYGWKLGSAREAVLCSLLVCAAVAPRVPWSETICKYSGSRGVLVLVWELWFILICDSWGSSELIFGVTGP